jgi:rRNA maturation endonuclease Nob1
MSARLVEVYELVCNACRRLVAFPVAPLSENYARCPQCGLVLEIEWRPKS